MILLAKICSDRVYDLGAVEVGERDVAQDLLVGRVDLTYTGHRKNDLLIAHALLILRKNKRKEGAKIYKSQIIGIAYFSRTKLFLK